MRRTTALAVLGVLLGTLAPAVPPAAAQEAAEEPLPPPEITRERGGFARTELWRYFGPSLTVPLAMDALRFLAVFAPDTRPVLPWIINPSLSLAHIPLYWLYFGEALAYTAAGLAMAAGITLPALAPESLFLRDAAGSLFGAYTNAMRFSVYEVYREARGRVAPEEGHGNSTPRAPFRSHGLWELLGGGFRADTILHPLVYMPALVGTAAFGAFYLTVVAGEEAAVWRTGSAYIGEVPVDPALGFLYSSGYNIVNLSFVATGEEALYRGVIYQELRVVTGPRAAELVDGCCFP